MSPMIKELRKSGLKGYGVIFNCFYELEPDYVEYYANVLSRKTWVLAHSRCVTGTLKIKLKEGRTPLSISMSA
ncbi:hypothetical protein KY284_003278 [Solanum tuberosum]|nr:hypothetical protein KY284_003278 [Solanum tuberosum]